MRFVGVFLVLLCCVWASAADSAPTFAQWANRARFAGPEEDSAPAGEAKVSTASTATPTPATEAKVESAGGYYAESKHLCLQEVRQKDCRQFGCNGACQVGSFLSSEFTCCKEDNYNYGYSASRSNMFMPKNSIGSCDWSISWFQYPDPNNPGEQLCPWVTVIDGITYKVGTAYGTCYFGPGSELCGEPICSQMVVSVQGDVFRTEAYSHDASQPNRDLACQDNLNFTSLPPGSNTTGNCAGLISGGRVGLRGRQLQQFGYGYDNYGYGGHASTTQTVFKGTAFIISGTIDSVSASNSHQEGGGGIGETHGCDQGLFEFVASFEGTAVDLTTDPINPAIPWIKANQYKLEFSCSADKGDKYGYDKYYEGNRRRRYN